MHCDQQKVCYCGKVRKDFSCNKIASAIDIFRRTPAHHCFGSIRLLWPFQSTHPISFIMMHILVQTNQPYQFVQFQSDSYLRPKLIPPISRFAHRCEADRPNVLGRRWEGLPNDPGHSVINQNSWFIIIIDIISIVYHIYYICHI